MNGRRRPLRGSRRDCDRRDASFGRRSEVGHRQHEQHEAGGKTQTGSCRADPAAPPGALSRVDIRACLRGCRRRDVGFFRGCGGRLRDGDVEEDRLETESRIVQLAAFRIAEHPVRVDEFECQFRCARTRVDVGMAHFYRCVVGGPDLAWM